ncbi:hypothetical protein AOQ84DRAFT_359335 [Glonium stellatum]|uniref:Uncharacterized protein n=1 Tax=Glonium stellatum TaxID=574774 RepID=A0A8E2FBK8_9PEZI|nr:hypothetical protein AOQ84DRAFT_359335 [Glonium stellatum]
MQLQSPVTSVDDSNDRLIIDYEALNTLSCAATELATSKSEHESRHMLSPITLRNSIGPLHEVFSSTTLIGYRTQQQLASGHNDIAVDRALQYINLTPPSQTKSVASFSSPGRQQSTATFADSGVITNGHASTAAALSLGSPWEQALELTDWMTLDSPFDLGGTAALDISSHSSSPSRDKAPRIVKYPVSNPPDTTRYHSADWDRPSYIPARDSRR